SLVTLAPSSSFAQEDDRELMQNQLSEFQKEFEGYPKELKKHFGSLANAQTETFIVELEAGKEYAFAGTCGNACADFDLVLTDDERFEVEVDAQPTDLPLIIFTSEKTGLYSLRSKMIRCYDDTCPFAVGVYSN
ncbi:hypothetical protein, partial [Erythrobacter sp.]